LGDPLEKLPAFIISRFEKKIPRLLTDKKRFFEKNSFFVENFLKRYSIFQKKVL